MSAAIVAVAWSLCCAQRAPAAEPAAPAVPLALQPYRVRIDVSFALRPEFPLGYREAALAGLRDGLDRGAGALWRTQIGGDRAARLAGVGPLARLAADRLAAAYGTDGLDKLYLVSVEAVGGGLRVAGREWDALTAQFGPVRQDEFPDRNDLSARLVRLLLALFRPTAAVEARRDGPVTLRPRGGALSPHDAAWSPLRPGGMFEAYYRILGKDKQVERIQAVPWTYLTVAEIDEGIAHCSVASGVPGALAARRRRIEVVALAATRQLPATRLTLVTRPPVRRPLGGVEIEVSQVPQPAADEGAAVPAPDVQRLVTDRNGQALVPAVADGDAPVWLFVRSGRNLLARVPFVPGLRAAETMELPDDSLRLEIEGQLAQLQSELVDTVARRAVLAALARNRAKAGNWDEAEALAKQLATMPRAESFTAELSAIRIRGQERSRALKDRATELRIGRLCSETGELIVNYLDEDKLRELREELDELKQVAQEEAAAKEQFEAKKKAAAEKKAAPPAAASAPAQPTPAKPPSKQPAF